MSTVRTVLLALSALLLACGCGQSVAASHSASRPAGQPPRHPRGAPPPAWADTKNGSRWLAYSSYCWSTDAAHQCADIAQPPCADPRTPEIELRQGERVHFHLGFDPSKVVVTGGGSSKTLAAVRNPTWKARRRNGAMTLSTRARRGDAAYAACLRFARVATGLNIHPSEE
jgi:hypothetical protein